jgi:CobQ-like glutamine amidotransferase family enzyme
MLSRLKQAYTRFMHGPCIDANVSLSNKLTAQINRLNLEILYTQESYELRIKELVNQIEREEHDGNTETKP